jgi:RNA polymerase sigma-70 factor (ECF subfamily)
MDKGYKDEEILALSLSQPSVFEALVDRYQDDFFRTALKIVHHKEEAEDIIQESFTKIYLNAKKFREVEGASFKSWAYKIVINTAFTHYQKLKRNRESVKYVDQSFYEGFAALGRDIETEADIQILVSRNLSKMPLHLQSVLKKYYLEDKSQKSIAKEEKVSVATIKMRLFRAKKVLRKILDGETCLIK